MVVIGTDCVGGLAPTPSDCAVGSVVGGDCAEPCETPSDEPTGSGEPMLGAEPVVAAEVVLVTVPLCPTPTARR